MSREKRAPRVLAGAALVVLCFVLGAWWALRPTSDAEPVQTQAERRSDRPDIPMRLPTEEVLAELEIDPETLAEAARGEHGLELRNRLCAVCVSGLLDDPGCKHCRDIAQSGRVDIDVVGTDGRPFGDHDVMVASDCGRGASLGSGYLHLPEGKCTLSATRVEGPFDIKGPEVEVEVVAGEESYVLLEIPSDPWGGIGVTLRVQEEGIVIEGLLAEAAAEGAIPEGAVLLEVDGEDVMGLTARQAAHTLSGPAGSTVEVRVGYEGDEGWVEETVEVERREIRAADVSITAGAPG